MKSKNYQTTKTYIREKVSAKIIRNTSTGIQFWGLKLVLEG